MQNFKDLIVWTQAIEIGVNTYQIVKLLPKEEMYGIRAQMTRAAISISSNIAEGCSRGSQRDFKRFLEIALGSSFELETQLILAGKSNLLNHADIANLLQQIGKEQKQLRALIKKINLFTILTFLEIATFIPFIFIGIRIFLMEQLL